MRIIWRTIAVFVCLMFAIAVIGVIIILAFWPKLSEEETYLPVEAVAFLPDGRRFATLNMAGPVRIWDVKTGRELRRIRPLSPRPSDEAGMIAMAVSPDGKYLAGSSNCENPDAYGLEIWDIETGKVVRSFVGHTAMVQTLAFTPDGRRILSAGGDREIRVWDVGNGRELQRLGGHGADVKALTVTPDGRFALSGGGDYDGGQLHDPVISNVGPEQRHPGPGPRGPSGHDPRYLYFSRRKTCGQRVLGRKPPDMELVDWRARKELAGTAREIRRCDILARR